MNKRWTEISPVNQRIEESMQGHPSPATKEQDTILWPAIIIDGRMHVFSSSLFTLCRASSWRQRSHVIICLLFILFFHPSPHVWFIWYHAMLSESPVLNIISTTKQIINYFLFFFFSRFIVFYYLSSLFLVILFSFCVFTSLASTPLPSTPVLIYLITLLLVLSSSYFPRSQVSSWTCSFRKCLSLFLWLVFRIIKTQRRRTVLGSQKDSL